MKVSSKSQKFKMGDAEIVQGVNCPIARWIYRGICMLAVVSWLIELALEPEFSSLSEPKQKESPGMLVLCSAPFLIYTVVVVSYDGNYVRCINSSLRRSAYPYLCVQHVVYTYFAVALIGYLGYQRPVWPACLFVVALVIVNAFIFYGVLRLDLPKPPEPEEEERDYQDSPV
ncbi:BnaAnng13980D [Brassica napus]|uniref:BnaAnng13980D protein n=1 Tax=Brassica napus TaxID=3708 RepID=A0A078IZF5_BRANA|nr:BnaAnng13980D [Brassica napus]